MQRILNVCGGGGVHLCLCRGHPRRSSHNRDLYHGRGGRNFVWKVGAAVGAHVTVAEARAAMVGGGGEDVDRLLMPVEEVFVPAMPTNISRR